ncbi:MAG: hypothetical protein ABI382_03800 [Nakamurella sp.]
MNSPVHDTPLKAARFVYDSFRIDAASNQLICQYQLDDWQFTETVALPGGGDWSTPAAVEAARLVFLLAGVSYYKAGAPPVIDLGTHAVTDTERDFLRQFYIDGLGEFAYRSTPRLDLSGLEIRGPRLERAAPVGFSPRLSTPLIPFGGGVDSIVTVELLRDKAPEASLFVVNRPGDRFEAIEKPSVVTGLPTVRAERVLDPKILRSRELGFRNGHVPVTGVISAIGVLAAAVGGHDAVVMSNEWSASVGTVQLEGRSINHQYSKSLAFEVGLRQWLSDAIGPELEYFSMLRPFTELWIAQRFSALSQYFGTFRSCNRAFHIDHAKRLDHWCGVCDKCAFIDLILAPFVDATVLRDVFATGGHEPLENPTMVGSFGTLLGLIPDAKPWECVGDVDECRVALQLTALRPDRARTHLVQELVVHVSGPDRDTWADPRIAADALLRPVGEHYIPAWYLPDEMLG